MTLRSALESPWERARHGTRFAVSCPHKDASEAALRAYLNGGNAVDGALAACCALAVVYPHMCTVGGDLFALVRRPDGDVVAFNGSGAAPLCANPEALRRRQPMMPSAGPATVTVPGMLSAWDALARYGARLSLSAALKPAIEMAHEGSPVSASLARAIEANAGALTADGGFASVFFRDSRALSEGDVLAQPALARTLSEVARYGVGAFYQGDTGQRYVRGLRGVGSPIVEDDLSKHVTELGAPLSSRYLDWSVVTTPPNSQGFALLEMLKVLTCARMSADSLGPQAPLLAHIFRLVSEDRDRVLADPRWVDVPVEDLLSEAHVGAIAAEAIRRCCDNSGETERCGAAPRPLPDGDTVAVVCADAEGWAVSVIQSLFHSFGAKILEPATGIIAQNRGACFSLDETSPNVLAPGKRPLHTLMPVLVLNDGQVAVVAGSRGVLGNPRSTHSC